MDRHRFTGCCHGGRVWDDHRAWPVDRARASDQGRTGVCFRRTACPGPLAGDASGGDRLSLGPDAGHPQRHSARLRRAKTGASAMPILAEADAAGLAGTAGRLFRFALRGTSERRFHLNLIAHSSPRPLAFAMFDWQNDDSQLAADPRLPKGDPLAAVGIAPAVRPHPHIYCQAGRSGASTNQALLTYLERSVIEGVAASPARSGRAGVFTPRSGHSDSWIPPWNHRSLRGCCA